MIRRFCDQCGVELALDNVNRVSGRLIGESGRIKVEVIVAVDGTWNGGEACEACVIRAVRGDDPLPSPVPGDRPPAPSPDPRSPEDGAVERGERSERERWFVIHVNQIRALRFAEFPVERLARASVAACNCGPHQIRKTTTVTYTDHGELELVPATPANGATR